MKDVSTLVIGLAGLVGSGKTTLTNHLEERFGFSVIRTRMILARLLEERDKPPDEKSLLNFGQGIFDEQGSHGLLDLFMEGYDDSRSYVIDSLHHISDYEYLRERFGERFHLLYVETSETGRTNRLIKRAQQRASSEEISIHKNSHSVEQEVPLLRDQASAVLTNKDLSDTLAQMDGLMLKWIYGQRLTTLQEMVGAVTKFHRKHGFDIGTRNKQAMHYRMGLIIEELGEINQCLSKGKGDIDDEHADLFILLLGNCIAYNIDLEASFWKKYEVIMKRPAKPVDDRVRVSHWEEDMDTN
jgi:dephospho-CoA kinase/NTP pyrophosphatase (non-canonical NTP hydrolase)